MTLVATPRAVNCTEAARVHPRRADAPAHDALRTVLSRTIARVIGETWEQAPAGEDVPRSHD